MDDLEGPESSAVPDSDDTPFVATCCVCHDSMGKTHVSLDRRTQQLSMQVWEGKLCPTLNILEAQEMFIYDSQSCASAHEPLIVAELQLQTTYPGRGQMVPCSRCAAPVDRSLPHVSYAYLTVEMDNGTVTGVIGDKELAVLCQDCEEPDAPAEDAVTQIEPDREAARA